MNRLYSSRLIILALILSGWARNTNAQVLFPVPNIPGVCGVSGCIVTMAGGSGGASSSSGTGFPDGGAGGKGGSVVCTLNVAMPTVITSLTYYVGMAGTIGVPVLSGTAGVPGGAGYGQGGSSGSFAGPTGIVGTDVCGGAGGGSSAVLNTTGSALLLEAGGGGGGGALSSTVAGGAGGPSGGNGIGVSPNFGGSGGTAGSFSAAGGAGIAYSGSAAGAGAPGNGGNGGEGLTGSQSGGGGGAGYGGGGGGGAGNTTALGVNTVTAGGGGGANYVNPTAITTGLINGTTSASGNGAVSLVLYPAIATTTGVVLCAGTTSTFTESTPGGVWSSSDAAIASVSATTGTSITVTGGVTVGVANISYTANGYYSYVTVTVIAAVGPITGPGNVCVGQTIALADTPAGGTWISGAPAVATVSGAGIVTGASAGTAMITYTSPTGCKAHAPVSVTPMPSAIGGITAVCVGSTITLTNDVPGGAWASTDISVATIDAASGVVSGVSPGITPITYSFSAACLVSTDVTVNRLPHIDRVDSTNPTTCGGTDGAIILNGVVSNESYIVNYDYNGVTAAPVTITADSSARVLINIPSTGLLDTGTYTNIYVTDAVTGCVSLPAGPVMLVDPPNPPPPVLATSEPICNNQTLFLTATDDKDDGIFSWTGPNGFTSSIAKPYIIAFTYADTGIYTLTYTLFNCLSDPTTADLSIQSPQPLTNVTISQTIPYGSKIQLNADNAFQYRWAPENGTLNNPNINNPVATPLITTTYTVYGMSEFGCVDSASVTITVDSNMNMGIPSGFTPNGDGHDDVFRPVGMKYQHLVELRVYNRWGQQVFYSNSIDHGWDGTFNGAPQDIGDYYYLIVVAMPGGNGENVVYKGAITLMR